EHLRQIMLAQHLGDVPEAAATSEEARERLKAQANQLEEATVLRLIDLLAVPGDDMRQGGDPPLPPQLAPVTGDRPASRPSRESTACRLERLEQGQVSSGPAPAADPKPRPEEPTATAAAPEPEPAPVPVPVGGGPELELSQLQEAWTHQVLSAVEERGGIPTASLLREAHPAGLSGDTLTLEFPPSAQFHLDLARDPKTAGRPAAARYAVTGRRLEFVFELGEAREDQTAEDEPAGEEEFVAEFQQTFDTRERES